MLIFRGRTMISQPKSEKVELVYEINITTGKIYIRYERSKPYDTEEISEKVAVNVINPDEDIGEWYEARRITSPDDTKISGNMYAFVNALDPKVLESLLAELPDNIKSMFPAREKV